MSFLNKIFGSSENEKAEESYVKPKFYTLTGIEEFETIDAISYEKSVVLFKHSTRCSISRFVLKRFDAEYDFSEEQMNWYLLDLLNYRDVSNEIARRYSIEHQSPQIIVVRNGKAVFNTSHDSIDFSDLKQFV
ncbi:bacillithiol system redox-active protein YtxJ [Flavobacterium jejuense]|uniref:Bacillithiol system redox-active protein YtxJ n=1 Tax=Flavobacterium jejuense TaxID=1544455 RepID=A0ABX0ILB2_9FLAO|nr:bacillithiol system redox-active protein YtxJ [Flavobacterium jejuense]NHN24378.1 bacillithiol system redox-active protein YtxJ [Flavobacterium jejuense]